MKSEVDDIKKIHGFWYNWMNYMKRWYYKEGEDWAFDKKSKKLKKTGKMVKQYDSKGLMGYDVMEKVEEYVKTHPDVVELSVDDDVFASSDLVLIPHPTMGITVIFIPQCTNVQNTFFLYPNHIDNLIKTLKEMQKKYKLQDKISRKRSK